MNTHLSTAPCRSKSEPTLHNRYPFTNSSSPSSALHYLLRASSAPPEPSDGTSRSTVNLFNTSYALRSTLHASPIPSDIETSGGIVISTALTFRFLNYQERRLRKMKTPSRLYPLTQTGRGELQRRHHHEFHPSSHLHGRGLTGQHIPTVTGSTENFLRYDNLLAGLRMRSMEWYLRSCERKH